MVRCDADTRQLYSSSALGSSSASAADWSYSKDDEYQGRTAQKPSGVKQDTRRREANLYRQISSGSIIGKLVYKVLILDLVSWVRTAYGQCSQSKLLMNKCLHDTDLEGNSTAPNQKLADR